MKPNYLKYGLFTLGFFVVIAVIYFAYTAFRRVGSGAKNVADTLADKAENEAIAKTSGLSLTVVDDSRAIANEISIEIETNKDMSYWDKSMHMETDEAVLAITSKIQSAASMRLVRDFYKNNFTHGGDLKADLRKALWSGNFRKIKFIEAI